MLVKPILFKGDNQDTRAMAMYIDVGLVSLFQTLIIYRQMILCYLALFNSDAIIL